MSEQKEKEREGKRVLVTKLTTNKQKHPPWPKTARGGKGLFQS